MSDPFIGIDAKIQRADEHIKNLNAEITTLLSPDLYRTASKNYDDIKQSGLSIVGPELAPARFSVITGEILYQLRSSLDHLVWQLVLHGATITPSTKHQFPICSTPEKYKEARERGRIEGIPTSAANRIESLQPYHEPKGFDRSLLWILNTLSVTDKHKLLVMLIPYATLQTLTYRSQQGNLILASTSSPSPTRPTEHGAEIIRVAFSEYQPDVKMDGKCVFHVAFEKFGPLTEHPVIDGLQQLRDVVVTTLNLFKSDFA